MEKIDVYADEELDKLIPDHRAARAEIILKDGRKFSAQVLDAKGEPENPGPENELYEKFRTLARTVLNKEKVEKIIDMINSLEKMKEIAPLTKLLIGQ
jgi:2-methylcitrate dehydratase PrpD